jgi:large subunit ribosomal protein L30
MAKESKVIITLVKSPIGAKKNQKDTLKALGLTKMNKTVEKVNNENIQGMIRTVEHLVKVEESK